MNNQGRPTIPVSLNRPGGPPQINAWPGHLNHPGQIGINLNHPNHGLGLPPGSHHPRGMKGKKKKKGKKKPIGLIANSSKKREAASQKQILFTALDKYFEEDKVEVEEKDKMTEFERVKILTEAYNIFDIYK